MSSKSFLVDRFVIGVDVKKYSARNTRRQEEIQRELRSLLDQAAEASGLDSAAWRRQGTGDGELIVLPADVDLVRVVARFPAELNTLLKTYNADRVAAAQIRLRLAMHIDALKASTYWYAGPALVEVSRILDARPLRQALDSAVAAATALIVSEAVYQKTVLSGLDGLSPEQFTEVAVDMPAKGFSRTAYVHVPGYDMRTFDGHETHAFDGRETGTFATRRKPDAKQSESDTDAVRVVNNIETLNAPGGFIGNAF